MTQHPTDMDGKPYAVGQTVLLASYSTKQALICRRTVVQVFPYLRVAKVGQAAVRGGRIRHPERHYIEENLPRPCPKHRPILPRCPVCEPLPHEG